MVNILIICKANSCRSQMAEAFLKKIDPSLQVFSAGIIPAKEVHPTTIKVMSEFGYDLSKYKPSDISEFVGQHWDVVITVCDFAELNCPVEIGKASKRVHYRFADPVEYTGSENSKIGVFREVRDLIQEKMEELYHDLISIYKVVKP
ncbi:MAG: arsenate reductase ArsC [Bacteroidetes bacterium]|nr:arsenate reductase ArsC [Bacteroidota bacterium]